MNETLRLGDIDVDFRRRKVRHIYLTVHPPDGRVTLVAPRTMRSSVVLAFAESRVEWIRKKQEHLRKHPRPAPLQYVTGERHQVWGREHVLEVVERDSRPSVILDDQRILLSVRPGTSRKSRAAVIHGWHKSLLHDVLPAMIREWEPRLGVHVSAYFLRRMKTRWGSCNHRAKRIRLNTELVKKPRELLEYVLVHELAHLIVPRHDRKFYGLMDRHYPQWRETRRQLNAPAPVGTPPGESSGGAEDGFEACGEAPPARQFVA
jgi:predicted metal-dependent hydrolase